MKNTSEFYKRQATESSSAGLGLMTITVILTVLAFGIITPMGMNGQNIVPVSIFCAVPIILFFSCAVNFYRDAERNMDKYQDALYREEDVEDAIARIIGNGSVPPVAEI